MKVNKLKAKVVEKEMNIEMLAKKLGINQSSLYRKFNNKLQYWSYKQVIDKLNKLSQEKGFLFELVEPAYTSQTCSRCGNINKNNRKGQIYQCDSCGCLIDADTNASINILHRGVYSPSNNKN